MVVFSQPVGLRHINPKINRVIINAHTMNPIGDPNPVHDTVRIAAVLAFHQLNDS
jgi:hypothetical protein